MASIKKLTGGEIFDLVRSDLQKAEEELCLQTVSSVGPITEIAQYLQESGGKRLRPALLLLSAGAAGYRGRTHLELATVVEFIHTATLLHDDVVDESQLRRGRETANAAFGNAASVLVGDFLYSRAFQMMVSADNMRVMQVLADATNTIAEGEVLQLMNCHDPDVDEQRYLEVIRRKTAKLFEAAARLGGVLAGVPPELEEGLASYGTHVGTAFQLVDDVLDYSGDLRETGKNLGDDLAEGKPTLPLIRVMRVGTAEERKLVRHAIERGGKADLEAVVAAIHRVAALDYLVALGTHPPMDDAALGRLLGVPVAGGRAAGSRCAGSPAPRGPSTPPRSAGPTASPTGARCGCRRRRGTPRATSPPTLRGRASRAATSAPATRCCRRRCPRRGCSSRTPSRGRTARAGCSASSRPCASSGWPWPPGAGPSTSTSGPGRATGSTTRARAGR